LLLQPGFFLRSKVTFKEELKKMVLWMGDSNEEQRQ
jgi:hypothetical protein